jgi:hypothetical protein
MTFAGYTPADGGWKNMTISGGIIVNSASTAAPSMGLATGEAYAITSSWATSSLTCTSPLMPKAWALLEATGTLETLSGKRTWQNPAVIAGYNIADTVRYLGVIGVPPVGGGFAQYGAPGLHSWGIQFATPMSHTNYMVQTGFAGEAAFVSGYAGFAVYPLQNKTVNGFTMSLALIGGSSAQLSWTSSGWGSNIPLGWITFVVYSNP